MFDFFTPFSTPVDNFVNRVGTVSESSTGRDADQTAVPRRGGGDGHEDQTRARCADEAPRRIVEP